MRAYGSEEDLSFMLAQYISLKYPTVLYHFDFGSGTKLTMGQAVKNRKLNKRAWPDLFIAYAKPDQGVYEREGGECGGLFIELKRESVKVYLKDGKTLVSSPHIREQAETLQRLRDAGYKAEFAIGFDAACKLIDEYLSELIPHQVPTNNMF